MQEKTQRRLSPTHGLIGSEHHGLSRFLAIILYVGREVTARVGSSTANAAAGYCEKIADPGRRASGGMAPSNFPDKHYILLILLHTLDRWHIHWCLAITGQILLD